jgi:hypothetical protein
MAEPPPIRARRRRQDGGLPGLGPTAVLEPAAPVSPGTVAEAERPVDGQAPEHATEGTERAVSAPPAQDAMQTAERSETPATSANGSAAAAVQPADAAQPPAGEPEPPAAATATTSQRRRRTTTTVVSGNPYNGARSRQFNVRLLDPLKDRYEHLVRELGDEGIATSVTEMLHALMHEGPKTADEARALLQRWRLLNAAL